MSSAQAGITYANAIANKLESACAVFMTGLILQEERVLSEHFYFSSHLLSHNVENCFGGHETPEVYKQMYGQELQIICISLAKKLINKNCKAWHATTTKNKIRVDTS